MFSFILSCLGSVLLLRMRRELLILVQKVSERHGVGEDICLGRVPRPRTGIQLCDPTLERAKTQLSRCATVESHLGFLKFNIKVFLD